MTSQPPQLVTSGMRRIGGLESPTKNIAERVDVDVALLDSGVQPDHPDLNVVGVSAVDGTWIGPTTAPVTARSWGRVHPCDRQRFRSPSASRYEPAGPGRAGHSVTLIDRRVDDRATRLATIRQPAGLVS
jgi:hypothetical protein